MNEERVDAEIIRLRGSVEIAPSLEIADAICDLRSTGTTLKSNDLAVIDTVLESQAILIGPKEFNSKPELEVALSRLLTRIRGVLKARRTKYVMMNAPEKALPRIKNIIPGLKSPTVVPLAEKSMVAIHSVVDEEVFWDVIEKLKEAGASGILVSPIEKMIV